MCLPIQGTEQPSPSSLSPWPSLARKYDQLGYPWGWLYSQVQTAGMLPNFASMFDPCIVLEKWISSVQHGDIFRLMLAGQSMTYLLDPANIKLFFTAPDDQIAFRQVVSSALGVLTCYLPLTKECVKTGQLQSILRRGCLVCHQSYFFLTTQPCFRG